jgi:hypothetical protein
MKFCGACGHTVHRTTSVEPPPIVNCEKPPTAQGVIPPPIAAPEDGKANVELVSFLAKEFSVPKANIHIAAGLTSPRKTIRVSR